MSTTLTVNPTTVSVGWNLSSAAYPANVPDSGTVSYTGPALTNGTGAGNADRKYAAQLSIAASGTSTINLSSLTDSFGNSISFARVKEIYFENSSLASASAITIGGAGSNPYQGIWSATGTGTNGGVISVRNGCSFHVGTASDSTGYAVGTGVNILVTNNDSTNAAKVNVVIIGCSA